MLLSESCRSAVKMSDIGSSPDATVLGYNDISDFCSSGKLAWSSYWRRIQLDICCSLETLSLYTASLYSTVSVVHSAVIQQGDCTAGLCPGAALFLHPPHLQGNESTDASEVSHEISHDGETIIMIVKLQPHKHQCYGIVQQVLRQSVQSAQPEQEEILA